MRSGDKAWVVLTAYVVAYDAWALRTGRETLSAAFGRSLDRPSKRIVVTLAHALLVGHLHRAIPPHLDPLRRAR